jgi:hypothetical protein
VKKKPLFNGKRRPTNSLVKKKMANRQFHLNSASEEDDVGGGGEE